MKSNKAQAALEFLTTYGWAIMVVMVAIGALAYFGVLNPSKSLPERCVFGNGLSCTDWKIEGDSSVQANNKAYATVLNGLGQSITMSTVTMTDPAGTCVTVPASGASLGADTTLSITCTATSIKFTDGDKAKAKITINYVKSGGTYNQISQGEVYATVQ